MHVIGRMKKHVASSPPPASLLASAPVTVHRRRPA
jgi:hypothetical protein